MATEDQGPHSNSGGAAVNAGVDFQQRVAAWFLVIMHCGGEPKALLDLPETGHVLAVRFEAQTPIDDVVLVTEKAGEVFVQVKRKVSLSEAADSDFVNTLRQFVNQYTARPDTGHYLLALPNDASTTIRVTLRKMLDQLRLDSDAWNSNPLSKAEEKCIETFRAAVGKLFSDRQGTKLNDETFIAFSQRVFVREYAVASGMGHETAALTLLGRNAKVPPELLWAHLIALSLRFAAQRASITSANLAELIGPYFDPSAKPSPELTAKLAMKTVGPISAGREVVLIEGLPDDKDIALLEFYRFDDCGYRRLRFKGNKLFWNGVPDGSTVLHRSATMAGMDRWTENHRSTFTGRNVYLAPAQGIEAEVHSPAAKAHAALLERMLSENQGLSMCLHCGKPLSQVSASMIEIDDDDNPHAIGAVHDDCLRSIDRVIGQLQCPAFEGREYLKKFDLERWVELRLHGQGAFGGITARVATRGKLTTLVWNSKNENFRQNSYCIEIALSDGTTRHIMSRGSLDRYDLEEATKSTALANSVFQKALAVGDPHCYTSVNFSYGPESLLLRFKEPEESLLECREARVVPYTVALGRRYQRDLMYYAPLCRFVRTDNEKPVLLRGCHLLLTDPFRLPEFIKVWRNAGIELPDYEIRILETDVDVDRWFAELFADGAEPIIDPVCDRAGTLVAGYCVADIDATNPCE